MRYAYTILAGNLKGNNRLGAVMLGRSIILERSVNEYGVKVPAECIIRQ
jgi:hypothetical protein